MNTKPSELHYTARSHMSTQQQHTTYKQTTNRKKRRRSMPHYTLSYLPPYTSNILRVHIRGKILYPPTEDRRKGTRAHDETESPREMSTLSCCLDGTTTRGYLSRQAFCPVVQLGLSSYNRDKRLFSKGRAKTELPHRLRTYRL
jgi:hypothetical protein